MGVFFYGKQADKRLGQEDLNVGQEDLKTISCFLTEFECTGFIIQGTNSSRNSESQSVNLPHHSSSLPKLAYWHYLSKFSINSS